MGIEVNVEGRASYDPGEKFALPASKRRRHFFNREKWVTSVGSEGTGNLEINDFSRCSSDVPIPVSRSTFNPVGF